MSDAPQKSLRGVMVAGYGARGVIYLIVGLLALIAAFTSNSASGTKDALAELRNWPLGNAALWVIAAGLLAYMIWRVIAGLADVDDHGAGAKGIFARLATVCTGLIHGLVAYSVAKLAAGSASGSGDGAQDWTAQVMQMPFGPAFVALASLILFGAGAYNVYKGVSGSYRKKLQSSSTTRRAAPLLKFGLIAYGVVLCLVAISIGWASVTTDPSQAGGVGQALGTIRSAIFGQILLAVAALGLMAFAVFNFIHARYRYVPNVTGHDIRTLDRD